MRENMLQDAAYPPYYKVSRGRQIRACQERLGSYFRFLQVTRHFRLVIVAVHFLA